MANAVEGLIHLIETSFAKVRLGNGVSIRQARVIDRTGYQDGRRQQKERAKDEQNDWRLIPDALIATHSEALNFMDAEGIRYNLPGYMRFALRIYATNSSSQSVFATFWQLGRPAREKFALLSDRQREAVRAFLKFFVDEPSGLFRDEAEEALEKWNS